MIPPEGFDEGAGDPTIAGRLEFVDGRLLYMPCGDEQQDTVTDVVITLGSWVRQHSDSYSGPTKPRLQEPRAADAAI
jgi:hypothetical protein